MLLEKTRYKLAFFCGRMEHRLSRILFGVLLLTLIAHANAYYTTTLYLIYADIILWLGYWISHTLERRFFPRNVR